MAGLFKARLQIISTYICIKIVYTICCKIMESGKLKIFFFCYGNGYMLRGGRERGSTRKKGEGSRDITRCLQKLTTRRRERRRREEERRCRNDPVWIWTYSYWSFQQLARCCLKICPQTRNKALSITLCLSHTRMYTHTYTLKKFLFWQVHFSRCVSFITILTESDKNWVPCI